MLIRQRFGVHTGVVAENGVEHRHALEGPREVVLRALVDHPRITQHAGRELPQHVLGEVHGIAVVGVGPVELEHGEFRVVPGRQPFIAEVAIDFIHLLEPAHHQALEVQLWCDTQVHIQVQRIVMGDEGLGRGTARNHLHHGGFHLHETAPVHVVADEAHNARTQGKHGAGLGVHNQVHITLTVAQLLV